LAEVPALLNFLCVKNFAVAEDCVNKVNDDAAKSVLTRSISELEKLTTWTHDSIEAALRSSLIEDMGLKPRIAFGAVRIATTGSNISPPLFESMELLGQEVSLQRIKLALSL